MGRRAKEHLPTVLLTLLSIVQALALELLWAHLSEHDYLYQWSYLAVMSWLQIGGTLLGVLLIWLIYSSLVMRFRWVPSTTDTVFPFLVGIVEFALIASLGPGSLGQWFLMLAVVFGVMTWVSQQIMRRARLDGENDVYFNTLTPATLRDHYPAIGTVCTLAAIGLYLWVSNDQGWFAFLAVVCAIGVLGFQMWLSDVFWRRSLAAE